MIARTAHSLTFSRPAMYLECDKLERDKSRVAWWTSYNLPPCSIQSAARLMERTAERNRMVQRPAYHLFVAVAPQEDASPARMRSVADRLLARLELSDHQAVAVGHLDRRHPHLHLVINRVHPETLHAWNATRDWPRIEAALRAIEAEMDFRTTPGRLAPTPDGRWCDNARAMPVGARRFELREKEKAARARTAGTLYVPRPSFLRFARESIGAGVRGARGWEELEATAARHGLALHQTTRGLVVTDGVHHAAISRVASGASLHRFTREFGEDYVRYATRSRGPGGDAPALPAGGARETLIAGGERGASLLAGSGGAAAAPSAAAEPARDPAGTVASEPAGVGGRGAAADPAPAGGGDGDVGRRGRPAHAPDPDRGDAPLRHERAGHDGDPGRDGDDRPIGFHADPAARRGPAGGEGDGRSADGSAPRDGGGAGPDAGGQHARSGEQHRRGAPRAGAVGGGAEAPHLPPRDHARSGDVAPDPAGRADSLPVLGDEAVGRGGMEPGNPAPADVRGGAGAAPGGDPARPGMAGDAGLHPERAFTVGRAPGGWAVAHPGSGRSWTLAREDAARRLALIGNEARTAKRVERVLRKLYRETARVSHRQLVARNAAGDLLDAAAAHCFADPVPATDLIRWNHMRRQPHQVREDLARGPAAFGALRIERDSPDLWAALREPRHEHLPAWSRFREAAHVWLDVQDGKDWSPPPAYPPPPERPQPPVSSAAPAAPRPAPAIPAPRPIRQAGPGLDIPFERPRRPGLNR